MTGSGKPQGLDQKEIAEILALTPMQEGMLFHYLRDPRCRRYCEQLCLDVSGGIDRRVFDQAWDAVVAANEMLRTRFRWEGLKNPVQILLKRHPPDIRYYDLSGENGGEKKRLAEQVRLNDRMEKFDLADVPFRVTLCTLEPGKHTIIVSSHHILYDGWSTGIILKEFLQAYDMLSDGRTPPEPAAKTPFREFVRWIRNQDVEKQDKFWREYLGDLEDPAGGSSEKANRGEVKEVEHHRFNLAIGQEEKIERFIKEQKITLAALLYGGWGILLQRYHNSKDVVFGTTVSGRPIGIKGIENMVGLFINDLPLRCRADGGGGTKILEVLQGINETIREREKYVGTPVTATRSYVRGADRRGLFDSLLVIENYPLDVGLIQKKSRLSVDSYVMFEMTHYDLTVILKLRDNIEMTLISNRDLFGEETVERIFKDYARILDTVIWNKHARLRDIELESGFFVLENNWQDFEFNI